MCKNEFSFNGCQLCNNLNLKLVGTDENIFTNNAIIEISCNKSKFEPFTKKFLPMMDDNEATKKRAFSCDNVRVRNGRIDLSGCCKCKCDNLIIKFIKLNKRVVNQITDKTTGYVEVSCKTNGFTTKEVVEIEIPNTIVQYACDLDEIKKLCVNSAYNTLNGYNFRGDELE